MKQIFDKIFESRCFFNLEKITVSPRYLSMWCLVPQANHAKFTTVVSHESSFCTGCNYQTHTSAVWNWSYPSRVVAIKVKDPRLSCYLSYTWVGKNWYLREIEYNDLTWDFHTDISITIQRVPKAELDKLVNFIFIYQTVYHNILFF